MVPRVTILGGVMTAIAIATILGLTLYATRTLSLGKKPSNPWVLVGAYVVAVAVGAVGLVILWGIGG